MYFKFKSQNKLVILLFEDGTDFYNCSNLTYSLIIFLNTVFSKKIKLCVEFVQDKRIRNSSKFGHQIWTGETWNYKVKWKH